MLVLSRKANRTIVIDDAVRVTVIGIKGDRVRLGIEAPPEVTVDRAEVHDRRMRFVDVPRRGRRLRRESVDLGRRAGRRHRRRHDALTPGREPGGRGCVGPYTELHPPRPRRHAPSTNDCPAARACFRTHRGRTDAPQQAQEVHYVRQAN